VVVLRGERIVVRPIRPDEVEVLMEAEDGVVDRDSVAFQRRMQHSGELVDGWLDLAIEAEGRLVGDVGARQPRGAFPPGVFEVGITVFDLRDRGKGYGAEAIRLVTRHLFESLGAERVQATTDVDNHAMRRVLEKLGFVNEGTLRSFMPSASGRADYTMYAVTRSDWAS
jgi:RimJ/RimL family protein N-acetyltransferase